MKKGFILVLVLVAVLAVWGVSSYNTMVSQQEKVESSFADIEAQLQRRADLIPNLVNTVQGYMQHEQSVIDAITAARESLLSAQGVQALSEANAKLNETIRNLMVLVENYPELKANENFMHLQDELAGTENRIATVRRDYNDAVRTYNTTIKRIPGRLFANTFGFFPAEYFEASEGSAEVPNVSF